MIKAVGVLKLYIGKGYIVEKTIKKRTERRTNYKFIIGKTDVSYFRMHKSKMSICHHNNNTWTSLYEFLLCYLMNLYMDGSTLRTWGKNHTPLINGFRKEGCELILFTSSRNHCLSACIASTDLLTITTSSKCTNK